jgi:uncharacterized membrane protein YidH (DUF202 family)
VTRVAGGKESRARSSRSRESIESPGTDAILGWDPDELPDYWPAVQAYYFRLNWIRTVITWTAFGLFLAALVALLG